MLVASIDSLSLRPITTDQLNGMQNESTTSLYEIDWIDAPHTPGSITPTEDEFNGWVLLGDEQVGLSVKPHRDLRSLRESFDLQAPIPRVVVVRVGGLAAGGLDLGGPQTPLGVRTCVVGIMRLLQEWLEDRAACR